MHRTLLFILVLMQGVSTTHAAEPQVAVAPREVPRLIPPVAGDKTVSCRDFRNRPVKMVDLPSLSDVGRAEFIQGIPIIQLNPAIMADLPDKLQKFFKLHECGHHALGHLFAPSTRSEKEADCWGIKQGQTILALTKDDVIGWKPYFAASLGSKFGHLPGPQRIEFLLGCFDEP
jgi:hypothetical protein